MVKSSPAAYNGTVVCWIRRWESLCIKFYYWFQWYGIWYGKPSLNLHPPSTENYDNLYVGSINGQFSCLDTRIGVHKWSVQTGAAIESTATIFWE